MKKTVRLTESDLTRIVQRIINEQSELTEGCQLEGESFDKIPSTGGQYVNAKVHSMGGQRCLKIELEGKLYSAPF